MKVVERIAIPYGRNILRGQFFKCARPNKRILIMHGAGRSSCKGFLGLQTYLQQHDVETITFDFVGHGATGGEISTSSLDARTDQALCVIDKLKLTVGLNLIGFSMGAHNALKIADELSAEHLGLAIPAVYTKEAESINFGPSFTSCIRRNRSWEKSECFDCIEEFKGKLLVISAENDQVIPHEIPCRLIEKAKNCLSAEHHRITSATHDLASHFETAPGSRQLTLNSIMRWLS